MAIDEDAEGEDDAEEMVDDGDESEDKNLYCICLGPSFGEVGVVPRGVYFQMIECPLDDWLR